MVSGALTGTLKAKGSCGSSARYGGNFSFDQSSLHGSKATGWSVNVNSSHQGPVTYKGQDLRPAPPLGIAKASLVLTGTDFASNAMYDWVSSSGAITITSKPSGKVNVMLIPDKNTGHPGNGDVHITGSWNCP